MCIYAFLLGAGPGKVKEIFDCTLQEAKDAMEKFVKAYPGLNRLKTEIIPEIARTGYFVGLDGRFIITPEERLVLAGMLQGGEACIVKRACVKACRELDNKGISYQLLNIVHDEMIFMVDDDKELAYKVKSIVEDAIAAQGTELNLNCPMAGDGKLGYNWLQTH